MADLQMVEKTIELAELNLLDTLAKKTIRTIKEEALYQHLLHKRLEKLNLLPRSP